MLPGFAAETPATNTPPAVKSEETASQELRTYLQLQEQLHETQLAIERTRKEAELLAAQNNESLAKRLEAIEQSLSAQRARELDAMQSSNRVMLTVAGAFAAMGFVAMLLMGYFQWKTINRLSELSSALPNPALQLGPGAPLRALGFSDSPPTSFAPALPLSPALLESLQQLEKRLHELEHRSNAAHEEVSAEPVNGTAPGNVPPNGQSEPNGAASEATNLSVLLNEGQSLLNAEKADEALVCFEKALALDGRNAEALVKKGAALEKLRRFNEAVDCYDRAIAADETMTIAYLYKGGVFNRMEKFNEALECYERALRTQEARHG